MRSQSPLFAVTFLHTYYRLEKNMLLEMLLFSGAIFYLLVGCCLFTQWLNIMQQDGRIRSGMLVKLFLVIVSILWPFVVPFAYLELLPKYKSSKESMSMFAEQVSESLAVESNA